MNEEQKELFSRFLSTVGDERMLAMEDIFYAGCSALRIQIERFINDKLQGERGDAFSMGQDDGLRWVLDHLRFIFDESC